MANLGKSQGYMAKIGLDLSDIDKQIKTLQTELKSVDKALATDADNAVLLNQRYTILNETINLLNQKFDSLTSASEKVNNALSSKQITDADFRAYQRAIEETKISLTQLNTEQQNSNKEMEQTGDAVKGAADDLNSITTAADNVQKAEVDITGELSNIKDQITDWTQSIAEFGAEVGAVLVELASECIEVGKQFETSMSLVAATGGLDKMSDDYKRLEDAAKQFGATTRYTASEAAEALNYLALAGYDVDKSIATLPNLLNLAQAGGLDFARSAEMLTNASAALGLSTSEMTELVDKMAVTARSSGTNVEQLGEAILRVGGTARSIVDRDGGLTEMNTILGILADNGIKASEGGTKLRNVLVKIAKPTKGTYKLLDELNMSFYDLEGNMRPLPEIFTEIGQKMDELQLTQQEKDNLISGAFNARDLAAINALLNTSAERYEQLANKINSANGASEKMAETMNDNLQGALYQLKSAREAVEIEIYQKIDEPLKNIVNTVADTVRGVSKVFEDESVAKEFTESFQKIADVVKEEMPNIIKLFEDFATKIVPRLGDVTAELIEFTGDKALPYVIKLLEWIMDHGKTIESTIWLIVNAMVADKAVSFGKGLLSVATGLGNINTSLVNLSSAAGPAAAGLSSIEGAGNAAAAGAAASTAAMSAWLIVGEAVIAALVLLAKHFDDAGEAAMRNAKYMNGFTDASNKMWERYQEITDPNNTQTSSEIAKQLSEDNDDLELALKERENYAQKLNELNNTVLEWQDGESEYDFQRRKESLEEDKQYTQQKILEYDREIEALRNVVHEEEELLDKRIEEEKEADRQRARNAAITTKQNVYSQKKAAEMEQKVIADENARLEQLIERRDRLAEKLRENKYASTADYQKDVALYSGVLKEIDQIEKRREQEQKEQQQKEQQAQREQEQADAESFAEYLEYQEELWDKKYHWDKENYKEYWEEKEKFLEENKVDTKEWNLAWNETEKKLGKLDDKTGKEIDKNLKDAEKEIKDKLTSFKNDLKLAVSKGDMSEWDANEKLGEYLRNNLDHNSELYKTEYTSYLDNQKKLNDQMTKEQDEQYKNDVKEQTNLVKQKFQDLENQAKWEGWSDRHLWNEKFKLLKQYKKDGTIYIETYDDIHQDLINEQATIVEKERKERDAQAKKDNEAEKKSIEERNKERKKIFEDAEKEAEDIVKNYYTKSRDELSKFGQSGQQTVTDAKGKERLVFSDYSKKIQELKAYQKNLERLKNMGLSNEHLKEIFSMDLDTRMKYISELINMGAANRERYLSDYNKYQKTVTAVSQTEVKMQSAEIKTEIDSKFKEMTEDASVSGESAGKAYMIGFKKGLKGSGFSYIDFLPTSIIDNAAAYDVQALAQANKTNSETVDLLNKTLGGVLNKPVTININDRKSIELTFADLMKIGMNSGSKNY